MKSLFFSVFLKKSIQLIFCAKNDASVSGFTHEKKFQILENKVEKSFQIICSDKVLKKSANYFWNNLVSKYLTFGDFVVPKNFFSQQNCW